MSLRTLLLLRGALVLVGLWIVVFAVVKVAGSMRATPEKVLAYGKKNDLAEIGDPGKRREVIGRVADMLNDLEPDELEELRTKTDQDPRQTFFEEMSEEEQLFFLEKRVGRAFQQMMQAFNEMERDQRRKVIERSLRHMQQDSERGDGLEEADPEVVEKIASAGLEAYYRDASAETKMDLAPLMEEMQRTMSRLR